VLCTSSGGTNATASCVSPTQAQAMNKLWYGQTRNGTAPSPAIDNSWDPTLDGNHLWYGLTRGSSFGGLGGSVNGVPAPFTTATDMVALEDQDPTLATPSFVNPTGTGANGWKNLSYAQLGAAYDNGVLLPQGSIHCYDRVVRETGGGLKHVQKFYRFFLIPGMTHGLGNGTTNPAANPPLPRSAATGTQQLYDVLTDRVEKGIAPTRIEISSAVTPTFPVAKSRPICLYPAKAKYVGGDVNEGHGARAWYVFRTAKEKRAWRNRQALFRSCKPISATFTKHQGLSTDTVMKCFPGTELTVSTTPPNGSCTTPLQLKALPVDDVQPFVAR
jgi:feruloyl esterase